MSEEIERRKFIEKKVQTYVKSLCDQNQKCKQFIETNVPDKNKSEKFILGLQHGGQQEASEEEASSGSDEDEN